jgi:predicted transcriptional regulator
MYGLEYDTSQTGFNAVLKDWQLKAMQVVWSTTKGANSRMVWVKVNQMLKDETISRASVINFLEAMRELGVISGEEETGKGGHHWVYYPKLDETGFKRYIAEKMIESLRGSFPEETREVIKNLSN